MKKYVNFCFFFVHLFTFWVEVINHLYSHIGLSKKKMRPYAANKK